MEKYIGKYRTLAERNLNGDPLENGFTYLRCIKRNRGGKVYRFNDDTLVVYVLGTGKSNNIIKDIKNVGVEILKVIEYDGEKDIHFKESDLDKIKDIIGLTSNGAKINPSSIRNHPRYKEIKKERFDALSDEEKEKRRLSGEKLREIFESKAKSD